MDDNNKTVKVNQPAPASMPGNQMPVNQTNNQSVNTPVNQVINTPYDMRLQEQPVTKEKSNAPLIAIIAALVAIIIVLIIALVVSKSKSKDKDKDTTAETTAETTAGDTTESSTEATTTETTVPDQPQTPGYVAPTALGSSWKDYNFSLDGVLYQLPIPYAVFMQYGWTAYDLPDTINAGDFTYLSVSNDAGTYISIILGNPGVSACTAEESYILGIAIDTEYDPIAKELTLPGNIKMNEATVSDVKKAYGTPDDYSVYEGEYTVTYIGENIDDGLDMEFDKNEVLTQITYLRAEVKDAMNQDASNVSTEVPAMNNDYVRPTSGSKAENDAILTIDGVNYQLPVPLSEFLANGWTLDIMSEEIIYGGYTTSTYISKGNCKLSVSIKNYTSDAIITANGIVYSVEAEQYATEGMDITFPGGIKIGTPQQTIHDTYSKYGEYYFENDYGDYGFYSAIMYVDEEMMHEHDVSFDMENGVVDSMEYSVYGFESYK